MVILIADDDRLIRFTIKSMLSEILELGYTFLEAKDGRQLVEVCREKMPDIVFVDIKMPYMDGITAIEECQKYVNNTEFVVVSGYSEFEYAKKCVSLGVKEYLLKPVEEEKLSQLMNKLKEKNLKNIKESNARFQLKCFDALNYFPNIDVDNDYDELELKEGYKYEVIRLELKVLSHNQELGTKFQKDIIKKMQKFSTEFIGKYGYYTNLYSLEGTLFFVFYTNNEGKRTIFSYLRKITCQKSYSKLAFHFSQFSVTNLKDVFSKSATLDQVAFANIAYPIGSIIGITEIRISKEEKGVLRLIDQLIDAWDRVNIFDYKTIINQIYQEFKNKEIRINLENVAKYYSSITGHEISSISYKELCRSLIDISEEMYKNIVRDENDIIERLKEYVENNYMNDISISQMAEYFNITPNYLSTIFHQKADVKFIDYLIQIRITNAKKLLIQNKNATIKDISLMVGYNSPRHFSTLFQRVTGETPSAYRKRMVEHKKNVL